ncbi:unnamed protein product [Clavelina lepadiformis]|uniref:G-protein coupled receptors family 1 profile domain-containing protein n=1 Tax=Clavelina lepadiformis TaxID=159417 RepID=A0ABP0FS39_CLALP
MVEGCVRKLDGEHEHSNWCNVSKYFQLPCSSSENVSVNRSDAIRITLTCKEILQCCEKNAFVELARFCDAEASRADGSDEVILGSGSKRSASLLETCPQCNPNSGDDGSLQLHCFKCLDDHLTISQDKVCDGVIDCHDFSDECLCDDVISECRDILSNDCSAASFPPFDHLQSGPYTPDAESNTSSSINEASTNSPTAITSRSYRRYIEQDEVATCLNEEEIKIVVALCERRPEYSSGECRCCSKYKLSEQHCDVDWKYLNGTNRTRVHEKIRCPLSYCFKLREKVNSDTPQLSRFQDDNLMKFTPKYLSSNGQDFGKGANEFTPRQNQSTYHRICFWMVAIVIVLGNLYVMLFTIRHLNSKTKNRRSKCNHFLVLNLAISDLLMGVFFLIVLCRGARYSDRNTAVEYRWRTSTLCAVAGTISMVSSETSCFVMALLTAYRLSTIFHPFKARVASTTCWKLAVVGVWFLSLLLALLSNVFHYFTRTVLFANPFSRRHIVTEDFVITFACRLSAITNVTMPMLDDPWECAKTFLKENFPRLLPIRKIGFYGRTTTCMPTFYVNHNDVFWPFSIAMITINFCLFLFVLLGYVIVWKRLSTQAGDVIMDRKQDSALQWRVFRLIATDSICWIPICIMSYVSISGISIGPGLEHFTSGVLLPINSALNPILYSPFIEKKISSVVAKLRYKLKTKLDPTSAIPVEHNNIAVDKQKYATG